MKLSVPATRMLSKPLPIILTVGLVVAASAAGTRLGACQAGAPRSSESALATSESVYKYKFENRRFYVPLIEVDLAQDGTGELRFKRGESDELIERRFKVLPTTTARINQLLETLDFVSTSENYQHKKDFSHLGWVTLWARRGSQERSVTFNHTDNPAMAELVGIFRAIATQEMDLFDLELALQHQPLDTPRLLEALENDLRLERVAEPERLLARLREMAGDDTLPLIARNHAARLIKAIEKGKYKAAVKPDK